MLFYKYSWDKQPHAEVFPQLPNYTLGGEKKSLELELLDRAFALSVRLLILHAKKLSGKLSQASPFSLSLGQAAKEREKPGRWPGSVP